ncbi:MAG TPA: hypothetical protein VJB82_05405 [Candidatus Peribacterales bacterium]|nr:hypothetical protein [Candidatus Peribacterales bacterium]
MINKNKVTIATAISSLVVAIIASGIYFLMPNIDGGPLSVTADCFRSDDQASRIKSYFVDTASAGMTFDHFLSFGDMEGRIAGSNYDVVVATVESVSTPVATNKNPPLVTLQIHDVLRGDKTLDRHCAIWAPFPHDVDYVGGGSQERIAQWEKQPLEGPAVGKKMILLGEKSERNGDPIFWISPVGHFDFTDQNLESAINAIKEGEEKKQQYKREQEALLQKNNAEVAAWRNQFTSEEIKEFTQNADFVGRGKSGTMEISSTDHWVTFNIEKIFKGEKKKEYRGEIYFVNVRVSSQTAMMLDEIRRNAPDTSYFLFLSEKDALPVGTDVRYDPKRYEGGIVIADEDSIRAVESIFAR